MNTSSFTAPVLQAADVVAGYGKRPVLQGLNLAVRPGEVYALLGSNGAGKTTTLGLFLGFLAPMQGQVRVGGVDPVRDARGARRQ
ncbi:MAG TPA: ATP-binding cassette domain-containing protein, partial [Rubrivivax sp.]|nr:ATP-binding cassette domain-containing protein [Rubrivivax sp.]